MSARSRPLERLALFVRRRYRAVFVGAALVFALAGVLTSRLHFDTDVLHLLPKNDPAVKTFTDTIAQMSAKDSSNTHEVMSTLFLAMNTKPGADRADSKEA